MKIMRRMARSMCSLLLLTFTTLGLQAPAHAGLVGTETVVSQEQAAAERSHVLATMERQDVQQGLIKLGVDPQAAYDRVAALSDTELHQMAGKLDHLPAGGDALGVVVFIFVLLLITDILGYTDVFPFVKKTVH